MIVFFRSMKRSDIVKDILVTFVLITQLSFLIFSLFMVCHYLRDMAVTTYYFWTSLTIVCDLTQTHTHTNGAPFLGPAGPGARSPLVSSLGGCWAKGVYSPLGFLLALLNHQQ